MRYLVVEWRHDNPDYPAVLYSELDDEMWEQRKVERYRDGRQGFADKVEESGGSRLGLSPLPVVPQIALDPQFHAREISKVDFEIIWLRRRERLAAV